MNRPSEKQTNPRNPPNSDTIRAVHAEIEYTRDDGTSVHSDICPPNCSPEGLSEQEYRDFLHICLEEWLNKSRGTGTFRIRGHH